MSSVFPSERNQREEMEEEMAPQFRTPFLRYAFLALSTLLLALGNCGGPLISRLYFLHGGDRLWLSAWLQTSGFPILLLPLLFTYAKRRRDNAKPFLMKPPTLVYATILGLISGLGNYFYSYGVARLPVSTSSLIIASQLVFTAGFAFLLVKQRFTAYSVNAVVLLTVGAAVLAVRSSGDRPAGETSKAYYVGFAMTVGASALVGLLLPTMEITYQKAKQEVSYGLLMEIQLVLSLVATTFSTIGMLVNHDFPAIPREAKAFGLGEAKYYLVLVWSAVLWQLFFVGAAGIIFCSSSLLSGILIAVLLPVTEVLSVFFYKEKFTAEKGISLALSLWGLSSYFYGEFKKDKKNKQEDQSIPTAPQTQLTQITALPS